MDIFTILSMIALAVLKVALVLFASWLEYQFIFNKCPKGLFHEWVVTRTWLQGKTEVTCTKCGKTSMLDCGMW